MIFLQRMPAGYRSFSAGVVPALFLGVALLWGLRAAEGENSRVVSQAVTAVHAAVALSADVPSGRGPERIAAALMDTDVPVYVGVLDRRGTVLAETGTLPILGLPAVRLPAPLGPETPRSYHKLTNSVDGHRYLETCVPIRGGALSSEPGDVTGYVRVVIPPPYAARRAVIGQIMAAALLAALLAAACAEPLFARAQAPLRRLLDIVSETAGAAREPGRHAQTADPLTALAEQVRELQSRLQEQSKDLVAQQLQLESTVRARTTESKVTAAETRAEALVDRARAELLSALCGALRRPLREAAETRRAADPAKTDIPRDLSAVIEELLEVAHPSGTEPMTQDFHLQDLLAAACALATARAKRRAVTFDVDTDDKLPDVLRGDAGRLLHVTAGLLIRCVSQAASCSLRLKAGVAEWEMPSITLALAMHAPRCAARATGRGEAFDLLLGVYRETVAMMGGRLEVVDTADTVGYRLQVPCLCRPQDGVPRRPQHVPRNIRALVVDTDPAHRTLVQDHLTRWGMRVAAAADADQALHLLQDAAQQGDAYGLVVVDMQMEGMDGIEFAGALQARSAGAPPVLVMQVPAGRHVNTHKARLLGIHGIVAKPAEPARLLETVQRVLEDPIGPKPFAAETDAGGAQFDGRVMVAEDNAVNQAVAEGMLESLGCRVVPAYNGREAVEGVMAASCDLILMDIQMPEMDGVEALKRIRAWEEGLHPPRRTPIVAVTAHAVPGDRDTYLAMGMDDYLGKPFDLTQLRRLLARHLQATDHGPALPVGIRVIPPAEAQHDAVLDRAVLDKIRAMDNTESPQIAEKLIAMFLEDAPRHLHTVHEAAAAGDCERARRALHTLKSSSANLGAQGLAALCGRLELTARKGDHLELSESLIDLQCEFARVTTALKGEVRVRG